MRKNTKTQKNKSETKSLTFYSQCCKKVGKVFVENWDKGGDGPFELEFIYHEEMVAMIHSIVTIKESENKEVLKFAYCGDCGSLINPPVETEFFMSKIKKSLSGEKI